MRKIIVLENHDEKGYGIKKHALKFIGTEDQTSPFIQVENRIKLQNPIFWNIELAYYINEANIE